MRTDRQIELVEEVVEPQSPQGTPTSTVRVSRADLLRRRPPMTLDAFLRGVHSA